MTGESVGPVRDFTEAIAMSWCLEAWLQTKGLTIQGLALDFTIDEAQLLVQEAREDLGIEVTEAGSLAFKEGHGLGTLTEPVGRALSMIAKSRNVEIEAILAQSFSANDGTDSFRLPPPAIAPTNRRLRRT